MMRSAGLQLDLEADPLTCYGDWILVQDEDPYAEITLASGLIAPGVRTFSPDVRYGTVLALRAVRPKGLPPSELSVGERVAFLDQYERVNSTHVFVREANILGVVGA